MSASSFIRNQLSETELRDIRAFCQRYGVEELYLFGSFAAEKQRADSDVDLLVKFKSLSIEQYTDNYFALHEALRSLFDRRIDLVTSNSLSNPFFIEHVHRTRVLIYEDRDS